MSAGDIIGQLTHQAIVVAKPIEADRLEFKGRPAFDPVPFMDEQSRAIFERPLDQALPLSETNHQIPRLRVHGTRAEVWKLLTKLDESGRLGLIPNAEVHRGLQAGLFCVLKDSSRDRLIFDSRPFNILETPPQRFIKAMGAGTTLTELQVPADSVVLSSGTGVKKFYYIFL